MMVLIPKVVKNYIGQFPETTHNAYKYFNYDRRVVNERAETRFDTQVAYKDPQHLTNDDYDILVHYAKSLINPILMKYGPKVACEDALHLAIRSFNRGMFDGKINANRYNVLLQAVQQPEQQPMPMSLPIAPAPGLIPVMAKKKEKAPLKEKKVHPRTLKELGVNPRKVLFDYQTRNVKGPHLVKSPGKGIVVREKEAAEGGAPNEYLVDFLSLVSQLPTKDIEVIRKLVGRWKQSKVLVKDFLQNSIKESGIDHEYAQKVADDFKSASIIMDKLEKLYDEINDFDMDAIKTGIEPLQELIQKIQNKEQAPAPEPSEEQPEEAPENTEENQPE